MIKRFIILFAFVFLYSIQVLAVPPDTLDFGFMRYYKEQSLLYYEPIQSVIMTSDQDRSYPSTVVFKDSVVFLTPNGFVTKSEPLSSLLNVSVSTSQKGKYIYIFGPFSDKPGGRHEVFDCLGNKVMQREDVGRVGLNGYGMPLEKSQRFLLGLNGIVTLTTFEGKRVNDVTMLSQENYEDGDIVISITPDENKIFAAVNKYKMPQAGADPEFVVFDGKLKVLSRRVLPYKLIVSQQCSSDGKYIWLRVELSDGSAPVIICDSTGAELFRLDNPQMAKFSADAQYLFNVKRSARATLLETATWDSVYAPYIPVTGFNWIDADISDNGNIVAFYEGNRLLIGDRIENSSGFITFPYAFRNVRLYDHGKRMVLSGEFGAVVYHALDK